MQSYDSPLPKRVRLLILGGGIHGVGLLHDLASRGWLDVHLLEKNTIGSATSSRSTKLIHGGLRYLKQPGDFPLVFEALHERALLLRMAPDLVKPIEIILPVLKHGGMPAIMTRAGLSLYDRLAGKARIQKYRKLSFDEIVENVPYVNTDLLKTAYSYWDMQTDDLALVRRVAASASKFGVGISEGHCAKKITPTADGWEVEVEDKKGNTHVVSALYIFNAMGPWANRLLESSDILPPYEGVNSKGVHIILKDLGHKAGLFLQSLSDNRMFFVLPWLGYTLVGTTETNYEDDPDRLAVTQDDINYLCEKLNFYFKTTISQSEILASFAGLRWLARASGRKLGQISRSDVIGELTSDRGVMFTLYGGKLTTYRRLCEDLGDVITKHGGEFRPSKTMEESSWVSPPVQSPSEDVIERFKPGGLAFSGLNAG